MKWNRRKVSGGMDVTRGLLGAVALIGIVVLLREMPAMRRYLRMARM